MLLPIVHVGWSAGIVVTKRAPTLDHGGDWVFPGGNLDERDATHQEAASRKASEELGIDIEEIRVIGQLSTYGPIVTGHLIEPYVGVIGAGATFAPNSGEVAAVRTIPLAELTSSRRSHVGPMPEHVRLNSVERPAALETSKMVRFYEVVPGEYLWRMQADVLHELLRHVTGGDHQLSTDDHGAGLGDIVGSPE